MERSINDTAADTSATTRVLKLGLGATPKVLLVDDDELVLARLRELITAAGFDTFTASSGSEALEFLEQSFAPIVITDLNMPTMGRPDPVPHHSPEELAGLYLPHSPDGAR